MIDSELAPARCPECGETVPLEKGCPLCRVRDASALDPSAVPAGPWPRLALVKGELPDGALWIALPAGARTLDLGERPIATLVSNGRDEVTLLALAALRVDGREVAPGTSVPLAPGARVHAASWELVRA